MLGRRFAMGLALLLLGSAACTARPKYDPKISATDFVAGIDHPYFPAPRGAHWVYVSSGENPETVDVRVLNETKTIMGVEATVVRDTVSVDGRIIEDTLDWYGQDKDGNVWYLGEETAEYEDGKVTSREGSWEWGVDGALPGFVMKAHPEPDGTAYFQEFYWGEAVDEAAVIARGRTISTQAGTFEDTVTTREWTRLEPSFEEEAHYAQGVGLVEKEVTKGSSKGTRESLVSYTLSA